MIFAEKVKKGNDFWIDFEKKWVDEHNNKKSTLQI